MRHSRNPITRMELEYMGLVRALPCHCCKVFGILRPSILHHVKWGNKRMGHRFVLPLCPGHHVSEFEPDEEYGLRISVHRDHRKFVEVFGTEEQIWRDVQGELGLPTTGWPVSRIVPRRVA